MSKKTNLEITLICTKLELNETLKIYSPEIERLIKDNTKKKKKATINDCESAIITDMYELWNSRELSVQGNNGIEALAKFIYDTFNISKKKGCKGYLSLARIKSILYEL